MEVYNREYKARRRLMDNLTALFINSIDQKIVIAHSLIPPASRFSLRKYRIIVNVIDKNESRIVMEEVFEELSLDKINEKMLEKTMEMIEKKYTVIKAKQENCGGPLSLCL